MAKATPLIVFRMRWMSASAAAGALLLALVTTLAFTGSPEPQASSASATAKLGPAIASLAAEKPAQSTQVIVRMAPGTSPAAGRELVRSSGGKVVSRDLPIINGFGAELRAGEAARIARDPRVQAVSLNGGVEMRDHDDSRYSFLSGVYEQAKQPARTAEVPAGCTSSSASTVSLAGWPVAPRTAISNVQDSLYRLRSVHQAAIGADRVWDDTTGKGVGVAVIDTGIAGDLPDFRRYGGSRESRVVASAVVNPCAFEDTDNLGHGTHVAGLIAGNSLGLQGDDYLRGDYMGTAPAADLISVKVADEDGNSNVLDVINGLQFAVDHKDEFNIRVINLSLSSTVAESYKTDPLDAAVEQAWNSGIVVVAAAGNEGTADNAVDFAPGNDPYVISVGAVNDRNTRTVLDDVLATWSSRGITQDGVRKPEVLAPGTSLTAALAPNSDFHRACPTCSVGPHRYFTMGGTSMSAAVVSGAVALLLEEHPGWTPNQVKGALMSTLVDVPGTGGEINVERALRATNLTSNQGLQPNELIDPQSGQIDWDRSSFRRSSFRRSSFRTEDEADTTWARSSFRCDCGLLPSGEIDPARSSFRRSSFRRTAEFDK